MKEWTEIYAQLRGTFAQRAGFVPGERGDSAVRLYALAAPGGYAWRPKNGERLLVIKGGTRG